MPIKNLWSLEPGECIVAEKIARALKGECQLFFPLKDIGTDLLIVRKAKCISLQVKESRYFKNGKCGDYYGYAFHQVAKKKIHLEEKLVDFFIFLTYLPVTSKTGKIHFEHRYLVVPTNELRKRAAQKSAGKSKIYRFYFHFGENEVLDIRGTSGLPRESKDYTSFVDAWGLIERALS
jgi:hypothetical protein